ncbi:hypothetical protein EV401DRAFT_1927779 [Pisolithus croceorrhizus]|nr:hypothetical protein EV401DRAFT_1927779 [Pisolithus croceorrhizus]
MLALKRYEILSHLVECTGNWLGVSLHGLMNHLTISWLESLPADLDAFTCFEDFRRHRLHKPISRPIGSSSTPGPGGSSADISTRLCSPQANTQNIDTSASSRRGNDTTYRAIHGVTTAPCLGNTVTHIHRAVPQRDRLNTNLERLATGLRSMIASSTRWSLSRPADSIVRLHTAQRRHHSMTAYGSMYPGHGERATTPPPI